MSAPQDKRSFHSEEKHRIIPPVMKHALIFLIPLVGASLAQAEFRTWNAASGGHQVWAELVRVADGNVLLKRDNGVIITVALASLSRPDQTFINGGKPAAPAAVGEQVEIKLDFPKPMFIGRPQLNLPNLEIADPAKDIKSFLAPKGTVNVAQGKKVISSDPAPIIGALALITDGDADGADGSFVELMPGKQWIQIDLAASHTLQKIALWHYHKQAVAYLDVVVQVSDDPQFKTGVTTLWNADHDDSSGMGKGSDPAYLETHHGRVIEGKATQARYVRLWSNGNTSNDMNHYCEVQIFAVPAAGAAPAITR